MFWTSQWCACLSGLIASYQVSVRQYRDLPVGFLHCIPCGKPACHLLTVRSVTSARKGLTPSGIISCYTLLFNPENLYFTLFSKPFVKCAHAHAGHTHAAIFHCRFRSDNKALSPQQRRCGTTGKQPAIGNANIAQTLAFIITTALMTFFYIL